jgi:hypothetical protein
MRFVVDNGHAWSGLARRWPEGQRVALHWPDRQSQPQRAGQAFALWAGGQHDSIARYQLAAQAHLGGCGPDARLQSDHSARPQHHAAADAGTRQFGTEAVGIAALVIRVVQRADEVRLGLGQCGLVGAQGSAV